MVGHALERFKLNPPAVPQRSTAALYISPPPRLAFHPTSPPMGNFVSCRSPAGGGGGRVVLSDGTVHEFDRPTSVAELMLEHPRQFVVDMRSLCAAGAATRVIPLPADRTLDPDKAYLMLPMERRKLSADEARRILSLARSVVRSRPSPFLAKSLGPLPAGICRGGVAVKERKDLAERKDDKLMERVGRPEWSPEVFGARPEFPGGQFSTRGWKPSLRTIEERALERKVPHWLF